MEFKNISHIDFGPRDARHAATHDAFNEDLFKRIYVDPFGIDKRDYYKGNKSFVFGLKGSGKSAFLKYMEIEKRSSAHTRFVYFSDSLQELNGEGGGTNILATSTDFEGIENYDEYWQSFIYLLISKVLFESDHSRHKKLLQFVRGQSSGDAGGLLKGILSKAPTMERWAAEISKAPSFKLEGGFENIANLEHLFSSVTHILSERPPQKPIYLFVDELEITFENKAQFDRDVNIGASLVRIIRKLNEDFRSKSIPVYICCAIRKEVSERILGGDSAKIVSDLGNEISWQRTSKVNDDPEFAHPLLDIIIRRIFYANRPGGRFMSKEDAAGVVKQYFPFFNARGSGRFTQGSLLDLTTYRPRDMSILFNEAKKIDGKRNFFKADTFKRLIRKPLREAMWSDYTEALRSRFSARQMEVFKKVFFRLPRRFKFSDFLTALDDFSEDPDMAEMLDGFKATDWANILKELYVLGAIGNIESGEVVDERMLFYFRGYTDGLLINRNVDIIKQSAMFDA
ncbi:hypothetical protein PH5382_03827 [Phaeobacter sp. CECT 5382]|uniref:P-loop ATPase, Sll1717 family n=1 Tax=Phaeobacter sp. CECT 5382 TaxID=1712645 RepID=UPI0006DB75B9|nr:hypothetical protein [Phaeobacter sp. CECT 5382]CUH89874.1 hypothetical protein PH5382_03827 [Phaeobacter sp. CECT 5382]